MTLESVVLVLWLSAFQAGTPEASVPSLVLPEWGLPEEQILELAVPDFRKRSAESKQHAAENEGFNEYQFAASIVAAQKTTLGLGQVPLLVVVIEVDDSNCNCCHEGRLAVIDLTSKQVVSITDIDGAVGPNWVGDASEELRLFHLFPDDPKVTLAVRSSSSCGGGGEGSKIETWYLASRTSEGKLQLGRVWHGDVEYGYSGRRGGAWSEGCGEIHSLWPKHAYRYVLHELVGWIDKRSTERDPFTPIERPCPNVNSDFGAVDFVSTSVVAVGESGPELGAETVARFERRDLRPTGTFPFNLPVRHLVFDAERLPQVDAPTSLATIVSPDGKLVAAFKEKGKWQDRRVLEIRRASDNALLRQIPAPEWVDDNRRFNEYGDHQFGAVGWSRDGRRCLAIRQVGLNFGPVLLSLTPDAKGDTWEGLIPTHRAGLGDGFVIDLPAPEQTSARLPAKHD